MCVCVCVCECGTWYTTACSHIPLSVGSAPYLPNTHISPTYYYTRIT